MKKLLLAIFILMLSLCLFAACGQSEEAAEEAAAEESAEPVIGVDVMYKDVMVPYDELAPADHIVVLQNAVNFNREGFYTEETKPVTENISYQGAEVAAYPISYVTGLLSHECQGDLTVYKKDGSSLTVPAADFNGMYVIIDDFASGNPPTLFNPESGTEVADFFYAVTAEGEGIISVVSNDVFIFKDVVAMMGWDDSASYTVCATDKFHIPVEPDYMAIGELRGSLSGAINGSFGDMTIASGKINDVVIIQPLQEAE